jgi:AcrR family transcriptional regulator
MAYVADAAETDRPASRANSRDARDATETPGCARRPWRERVVERSLGEAARQSLDRAETLIRATIELLESSGENVTVQDVADRAGVSLRVLYRHFSSKDDLLAAVLEDRLEKGAHHLRRRLAEVDDPIERLAEFIRLTIHVERTSLNLALAKNETVLLLSHPEQVARAQTPMALLGTELVQAAVQAGRIDPALAGHGVYSMMALKRAYNRACLLEDDLSLPLPTKEQMVRDCLRCLGVSAVREPVGAVREPAGTVHGSVGAVHEAVGS